MLTFIPEAGIHYEWGALQRDILAAKPESDRYSIDDIRQMLSSGEMQAWRVSGDGTGHVVTWYGRTLDTDVPALWVMYAAGKLFGGPKQRLATMRRLMGQIEDMARQFGCREVRVEERDTWKIALTDYQSSTKDNGRILLRKVL